MDNGQLWMRRKRRDMINFARHFDILPQAINMFLPFSWGLLICLLEV
jgi:hypothetical protein